MAPIDALLPAGFVEIREAVPMTRSENSGDYVSVEGYRNGLISLEVFGSGPLKPVAKRQAQALGISKRVTFYGKVSHEHMVRAFSGAHALLQTSIGFETQGLTVFEALAVGTPSVVSDRKIASELPHGTYWLEDTGTLRGLSRVITQAANDIVAGRTHRPQPDQTEFLRQSVSTAAMLELYRKAIVEHSTS
jgi:glycosyltransferase involved in cell wall biosynthesis